MRIKPFEKLPPYHVSFDIWLDAVVEKCAAWRKTWWAFVAELLGLMAACGIALYAIDRFLAWWFA